MERFSTNSEGRKRNQEAQGINTDLKFYTEMHVDPPTTKEERRQHNLSLRPLVWRRGGRAKP